MKQIEREAVMEALKSFAPRALHVAELCGRLQVAKGRRDEVLDVLDGLVSLGLVQEMPGNRFRVRKDTRRNPKPQSASAAAQAGVVVGRLNINPRGFAFVAPEDGSEDVYLPADAIGAALHNDRVEVAARPSPKGRDGRVTAVLQRRDARFTATLHRRGKSCWLEPDDPRLRSPITVLGEPPKTKASGLAVVGELTRFPQSLDDGCGAEIVEILGVQGMTAVEVSKIKIREGVVEEFGEEVLAEATEFSDRVLPSEKDGRTDLRDLDLCTIDPEDARDHDDALFAERTADGFRLVVAIADVSHYVRPGTAIDRSALERGTSIYLPDRAIPMLPPELSSNLASLVPKHDRLCMAVDVELSKNGKVRKYKLLEGVMKSKARLTYGGVARALGLTKEPAREGAAEHRAKMLKTLLDLSRVLRRNRLRRGALDFDLPEARVRLDAHNVEPLDVYRSRIDPGVREAYRLVEEMMLLANEVVAAELKKKDVPAIYRAHGKPDEKKLELFSRLAAALGHKIDIEAATDPKQLSKFLTSIEGTDEAPVLRFLLLRAMQQAVYDTDGNIGHFGLGTKDYLHFTSPIRRYPDLAVHRVVRALIRQEPIDAATLRPALKKQAAESSRLERRAMVVERDVVALYRAILMRERVEEDFMGTIASIESFGFRVAFDEPFVEAMVPVETLGDDFYELDELGIRLIGQRTGAMYSLGERIAVRVTEVNIARREIRALPVELADRQDEQNHDRSDGRSAPRRRRRGNKGRTDAYAQKQRRKQKDDKRANKTRKRRRR